MHSSSRLNVLCIILKYKQHETFLTIISDLTAFTGPEQIYANLCKGQGKKCSGFLKIFWVAWLEKKSFSMKKFM